MLQTGSEPQQAFFHTKLLYKLQGLSNCFPLSFPILGCVPGSCCSDFFSQCFSSRLPPLRWARSLCLLPAASISGPSSVHALVFRPQLCNHKQITYPCCNCRSSGLWGFKIMVPDEVRCVCVFVYSPFPIAKSGRTSGKTTKGFSAFICLSGRFPRAPECRLVGLFLTFKV